MADKARTEANKTSNEFSNVVNSRKTPDQPAATGQSLTRMMNVRRATAAY